MSVGQWQNYKLFLTELSSVITKGYSNDMGNPENLLNDMHFSPLSDDL